MSPTSLNCCVWFLMPSCSRQQCLQTHQAVCDLVQLVSQSGKWWQMLRWMRSMDCQRLHASDCSSPCAPSQDVFNLTQLNLLVKHLLSMPLIVPSQVLPSFQYIVGLLHGDAEP